MKGAIIINAYYAPEEYTYQPKRLKEEFEKLGVQADIIKNDCFPVTVDAELINGLKGYDFCVYLDKDKYVLDGLNRCGMRLFNGYEAIEVCDDKMSTYLALAGQGVNLPKTLPGALCYNADAQVKISTVERVERELGYPLIIKECFGSRGTGVYLVHDRCELLEKMQILKCTPHLFQEFVCSSAGRDVRVIVIGHEVVGAILRRSDGDFRSNVALGGSAEPYTLTEETAKACIKVSRILKLDYCGVDVLFGPNGEPIICEVNSNAFFFGFERATKINVAKIYAQYVINKMGG